MSLLNDLELFACERDLDELVLICIIDTLRWLKW